MTHDEQEGHEQGCWYCEDAKSGNPQGEPNPDRHPGEKPGKRRRTAVQRCRSSAHHVSIIPAVRFDTYWHAIPAMQEEAAMRIAKVVFAAI
jgi:hypothetical protein